MCGWHCCRDCHRVNQHNSLDYKNLGTCIACGTDPCCDHGLISAINAVYPNFYRHINFSNIVERWDNEKSGPNRDPYPTKRQFTAYLPTEHGEIIGSGFIWRGNRIGPFEREQDHDSCDYALRVFIGFLKRFFERWYECTPRQLRNIHKMFMKELLNGSHSIVMCNDKGWAFGEVRYEDDDLLTDICKYLSAISRYADNHF